MRDSLSLLAVLELIAQLMNTGCSWLSSLAGAVVPGIRHICARLPCSLSRVDLLSSIHAAAVSLTDPAAPARGLRPRAASLHQLCWS